LTLQLALQRLQVDFAMAPASATRGASVRVRTSVSEVVVISDLRPLNCPGPPGGG
jgi:hypothetical protein